MNRYILILFFSLNFLSFGQEPIKIYGDTNYSQYKEKSLVTTINVEYRVHVYENKPKNLIVYLCGKISHDYNHFGTETKTNVFTTFGIDF
jgi:hypothetical protein